MTWVKICGTTTFEDAQMALQAGANAVGFVFAPSRRRVMPEQVREIVAQLPARLERVGVFVNESEDRIAKIVGACGLTAVQLHGDETPEFGCKLRALLPGTKIFRALPFAALAEAAANRGMRDFFDAAGYDAWLLDGAPVAVRGGAGISFDWLKAREALAALAFRGNLIVAGGLDSENVAGPLEALHPWGVDVVSGVEAEPGRKDARKVRSFVQAVRQWESQQNHGNG